MANLPQPETVPTPTHKIGGSGFLPERTFTSTELREGSYWAPPLKLALSRLNNDQRQQALAAYQHMKWGEYDKVAPAERDLWRNIFAQKNEIGALQQAIYAEEMVRYREEQEYQRLAAKPFGLMGGTWRFIQSASEAALQVVTGPVAGLAQIVPFYLETANLIPQHTTERVGEFTLNTLPQRTVQLGAAQDRRRDIFHNKHPYLDNTAHIVGFFAPAISSLGTGLVSQGGRLAAGGSLMRRTIGGTLMGIGKVAEVGAMPWAGMVNRFGYGGLLGDAVSVKMAQRVGQRVLRGGVEMGVEYEALAARGYAAFRGPGGARAALRVGEEIMARQASKAEAMAEYLMASAARSAYIATGPIAEDIKHQGDWVTQHAFGRTFLPDGALGAFATDFAFAMAIGAFPAFAMLRRIHMRDAARAAFEAPRQHGVGGPYPLAKTVPAPPPADSVTLAKDFLDKGLLDMQRVWGPRMSAIKARQVVDETVSLQYELEKLMAGGQHLPDSQPWSRRLLAREPPASPTAPTGAEPAGLRVTERRRPLFGATGPRVTLPAGLQKVMEGLNLSMAQRGLDANARIGVRDAFKRHVQAYLKSQGWPTHVIDELVPIVNKHTGALEVVTRGREAINYEHLVDDFLAMKMLGRALNADENGAAILNSIHNERALMRVEPKPIGASLSAQDLGRLRELPPHTMQAAGVSARQVGPRLQRIRQTLANYAGSRLLLNRVPAPVRRLLADLDDFTLGHLMHPENQRIMARWWHESQKLPLHERPLPQLLHEPGGMADWAAQEVMARYHGKGGELPARPGATASPAKPLEAGKPNRLARGLAMVKEGEKGKLPEGTPPKGGGAPPEGGKQPPKVPPSGTSVKSETAEAPKEAPRAPERRGEERRKNTHTGLVSSMTDKDGKEVFYIRYGNRNALVDPSATKGLVAGEKGTVPLSAISGASKKGAEAAAKVKRDASPIAGIAVRLPDGTIIAPNKGEGHIHYTLQKKIVEKMGLQPKEVEPGWITHDGKFVTDVEGAKLMEQATGKKMGPGDMESMSLEDAGLLSRAQGVGEALETEAQVAANKKLAARMAAENKAKRAAREREAYAASSISEVSKLLKGEPKTVVAVYLGAAPGGHRIEVAKTRLMVHGGAVEGTPKHNASIVVSTEAVKEGLAARRLEQRMGLTEAEAASIAQAPWRAGDGGIVDKLDKMLKKFFDRGNHGFVILQRGLIVEMQQIASDMGISAKSARDLVKAHFKVPRGKEAASAREGRLARTSVTYMDNVLDRYRKSTIPQKRAMITDLQVALEEGKTTKGRPLTAKDRKLLETILATMSRIEKGGK